MCCVVPCCRPRGGATSASSSTWFGNPGFRVMPETCPWGPPCPAVTISPSSRRQSNLSHCAAPVKRQGWKEGLIPPAIAWELAPGVCGYAVLVKMESSVKVGAWRCWRTPSPLLRGQGQGQQVRGLARSAESGTVCAAVHRAWRELHVPAESAESCSVGRGTPVMSLSPLPPATPNLQVLQRAQVLPRGTMVTLCEPCFHPYLCSSVGSWLLNTGKRTRLRTLLRWHLAASPPASVLSRHSVAGKLEPAVQPQKSH